MRTRRGATTAPDERIYVARPVEGQDFGIGTVITPGGAYRPIVGDGATLTWSFAEEPVLEEGATVELLGPMSAEQAENVQTAMREERTRRATEKKRRVAVEALDTAALILGPYEPAFTHLSPAQQAERVEVLALVIFQARGYPGATELPG